MSGGGAAVTDMVARQPGEAWKQPERCHAREARRDYSSRLAETSHLGGTCGLLIAQGDVVRRGNVVGLDSS
jgi:hypothetical protein